MFPRSLPVLALAAVVGVGATLSLGSPGGTPSRETLASRSAKKKQAQQKLRHLNAKIREVRVQKRNAEVRERTFAVRLQDTQLQLSETKQRIYAAETKLRDAVDKLDEAKAQLAVVRARLEQRNRLLARRLVAAQRRGTVTYAAVLFRASDYWDFLSRKRFMARVVSYDVQLVNAIRRDEADVVRWRNRLAARTAEQKEILSYLADQRALRESLMASQSAQLEAAARDAARYEQMLAELEANSSEIQAFIQRLEATPAGRRRAAIPFRGGFWRPVNGRISSGFGMRFHPILHRTKLHTGVDFSAPTGSPIHAAARGTVIHAGWWGAYGNAVIVDHGGGLTTLYGHMSKIACSPGQDVSRGRVLGYVGSTGWSTGPHLHYEVRRNGVPVNPLGQF